MPSAITNLTVTVSGSTVTLTWTNPAGTARNLIFRDSKMILDTTTGIGTFVDPDVPAGMHAYGVVPIGDTATVSATVGTVTPPPGVPAAPTNLTANVSGSTVTLNYTNPSTAQGNDFYRNNVQLAWVGYPNPVVQTWSNTNVAAGTYTYAVAAYDGSGVGAQATVPATVVSVTPPPPPPPPPGGTPLLGLYTGANSVQAVQSLASTLGVSAELGGYSVYCDGTSWSSISSFRPPSLPSGVTLLLGVDLTQNSTGLSQVAGNVGSFVTLAKNLIGTPTIVRLGWEFDGSWMPWGNGANGNTPQQYNPAVAAVIPAMKAANPALKFDFCCNSGTSSLAQLEVYYGPNGDSLWDFIGGDHYDNQGGGGNASQMGACVQLAAARGKPLSCGEWGLNGADNPTFINDMAQVFLDPAAAAAQYGWPTYTVGYHSYFSDDLQINSDITQFPNSIAAFKAAFG